VATGVLLGPRLVANADREPEDFRRRRDQSRSAGSRVGSGCRQALPVDREAEDNGDSSSRQHMTGDRYLGTRPKAWTQAVSVRKGGLPHHVQRTCPLDFAGNSCGEVWRKFRYAPRVNLTVSVVNFGEELRMLGADFRGGNIKTPTRHLFVRAAEIGKPLASLWNHDVRNRWRLLLLAVESPPVQEGIELHLFRRPGSPQTLLVPLGRHIARAVLPSARASVHSKMIISRGMRIVRLDGF